MRWSQGVWSEERIRAAVDATDKYFALPYGPSGVAPDSNPREFELYFERLEQAGRAGIKRPDLLVFRRTDKMAVDRIITDVGGVQELPFLSEVHLKHLLELAVIAVECENSLWVAKKMPDYGCTLTPQRRRGGALGLKKTAVLPTVIIKDEDLKPLLEWQSDNGIPIHIWHVFYDLAFGLSLDEAMRLIREKHIEPTEQTFQAPNGITTTKVIYKIYYLYAYPLGEGESAPELKASFIEDKNGHILPYVTFSGGNLKLCPAAIKVLDNEATAQETGR